MAGLRLGEIFCGPGGLALGAHQAGFRHRWAIDLDPHACATYRRNIPGADEGTVLCGDAREIGYSALAGIDVLAFGFPCNDFSLVGEHKGLEGSYGPLYQCGIAALKAHNPLAFVAENVAGLGSANGGDAFRQICSELEGCGYEITAHLYKSEFYGVPQRRHRWVIAGLRRDLGASFTPPEPGGEEATAGSALAGIPNGAANHEMPRHRLATVERLKRIRPGQNAFTADLPPELQIKTKTTISQIYRRLDPAKPAYTITGSGGGGTHVYHWAEPRALTNRERARLQGFPDDFIFEGGRDAVRKQIGMAVPPPLARAVMDQMVISLETAAKAAA